jgi:allantoate deiminase
MSSAGHKVIEDCIAISRFTEESGRITRRYLRPQTKLVHAFLQARMESLGMSVTVDAVGNLRGALPCPRKNAKRLLIGSHIDTVPNAGAYDGVLGVVAGIALIESLQDTVLPYEIEVIAFSEEEGVRFHKPFLGSKALVGEFEDSFLDLVDEDGITVADVIEEFGLSVHQIPAARYAANAAAYFEIHIEQGPVLESLNLPLGVVTAIVGQTREEITWTGHANHAGTTPMHLRRDALAAAAELLVAAEKLAKLEDGLTLTVGNINAKPGVGNVVPGLVKHSLDIRHAQDAVRLRVLDAVNREARDIASRRNVQVSFHPNIEIKAVAMAPSLVDLLAESANACGHTVHRMVSGAGHDAMVIAPHLPSVMLFLRSPGGLSHHPEEGVIEQDLVAGLQVAREFLIRLGDTMCETQGASI